MLRGSIPPADAVIAITGGNAGIGFGMTRALLVKGRRVAVLDLETDRLDMLANEHPGNLLAFRCDVRDEAAAKAATARIIAAWGRIDVLINNACQCVFKSFAERTVRDIREEYEVNFFGYVNMIYAVLPYMRERGRGIIHNMGSGICMTGFPGLAGYTAAKGAIESLARTLALELRADGIAVDVMHPPLTHTRSSSHLEIPGEMLAQPEDVGRRLAGKIFSTKPWLTGDFTSWAGLRIMRLFPGGVGRLLAHLTERTGTRAGAAARGGSR